MTTVDQPVCPYPFPEAAQLGLSPEYGQFRRSGELGRLEMPYGGQAWLVTGLADVKLVLADPRFSRAAAMDRDVPRTMPMLETEPGILSMDAPEHTRLRRTVARAFTVRGVEALRPKVQALVDTLVDRLVDRGPEADLVTDFALPLAITTISELLGVPEADREQFHEWSDLATAITGTSIEEIQGAQESLDRFLGELVARRRVEPSDDLLGTLVAARDVEDRLSERELVRMGTTLLAAGHETTANQLGGHVFTLLEQREHWDRLVAEPELVPAAVEELLRLTPLGVVTFCRIAKEDLELGGVVVKAGEAVVAQIAAANRDEVAFANPDELDFDRAANPHIAFGHGLHHCLGAPLARVELQVGLGTLLRRLPGLRLAVPAGEVRFKTGRLLRGPKALPVTW